MKQDRTEIERKKNISGAMRKQSARWNVVSLK